MPKKFDFISPGVQLNEIDESVLPATVSDAGPVLIGRALAGPAMQPVIVKNYADFVSIFGEPISGEGASDVDVWRDGNKVGPTYASYAAQAHLSSETTPITFIRLLGEANTSNPSADGQAGWDLGAAGGISTTIASNKTAYGLFVFGSGSTDIDGTLGAIIYTNGAAVTLSGIIAGTAADTTSSAGVMIESQGNVASQFKIEIWENGTAPAVSKNCHFSEGSSNFIRDQLNTNPQKLDASNNFNGTNLKYFVGETFEQAVNDQTLGDTAAKQYGIILPLQDGSFNLADHRQDKQPAKTGWFINRKPGDEKLFRLVSLHDGEWFQNNYELFIEDLKLGDRLNASTFSIVLKDLNGSAIESWRSLNLDPASDNYIAKKIGNQSFQWNATELKHNVRGLYVNKSDYFRVEVADAVANNTLDDTLALPMGFEGPLRPKGFKLAHGSTAPNPTADAANEGAKAAETLTFVDQAGLQDFDLVFTVDGTTYTISHVNGGNNETVWTADGDNWIAEIDGTAGNKIGFANLVYTLINKIDTANWTASGGGTDRLVLEANVAGPHRTIVYSETGTDNNGAVSNTATRIGTDTNTEADAVVKGNAEYPLTHGDCDNDLFAVIPNGVIGSVTFPTFRMTVADSNINANYKRGDYFGIRHIQGQGTSRDKSWADLTYALPKNYTGGTTHESDPAGSYERAFTFHLEDVCQDSTNSLRFYYQADSYGDGDSTANAQNVSAKIGGSSTGIGYLCGKKKIKQYRAAFWGGYDGLDIKKVEPFSNTILKAADGNAVTSYALNSVMKAIDIVRDPEVVEMDMFSMPGCTNEKVTNEILEVATERGDSLAILDVEGGFRPTWESNSAVDYGSISSTLTTMETRQLNNSYGATYYPWVVIRDSNADVVPVPSSVAAIGALAKSTADSEVWFAPAGFNRGGIKHLGSNTSGLIVTHTIEHLTKDNRDDLYALNVNPIARFPATNQIVIFGQKTLQQTASALDRINVRRLLLFLKRRIGKIADTILFEPNVETTWNNFKAAADTVLSSVQSKLGITEYKLILDESTTTADLIDRNIMYAKIMIKPARAIEFIVVDFVVTRSGVEF